MKKNLIWLVFAAILGLSAQSLAVKPKVVKTIPENGNQNVDPALKQIRIEFNQDMTIGDNFSICGGGPLFPKTIGKPKWINNRTLIMQVALAPVHEYQMSVNCQDYQACRNTNGEPAEIYPVSFRTGSAASQDPNKASQSPVLLLQQGIYAEETEGNLDKAMEIYSQIRNSYNDVERIAARATYQLGMCYLKKGDKEKAITYFEEVIDYFPQQKSAVEKAQQQLDKIKPADDIIAKSYVVHYKAVDSSQDAFEIYKQNRAESVRTHHASRYQENGQTINSICTYTEEEKDKLVAAIKANERLQLVKVESPQSEQGNIFDMLGQASSFIGSKYGESCAEAGMKKLYSNSHIYVVDKNFVMRWGGIGYAMNFSDKPITGKYRLSGTTYPNQKLYDVMDKPIDVEILPDPNRNGFYDIYWTPKEPFQPGGFFSYGWAVDGSKQLAKTEQGYQLKMNNRFGDRCFETFFLAVPEGMQIASKSEEYTGKQNIDGWDIYWWKKEVCKNTDHTVNVTLAEKKSIPNGPKAISFYPKNGDVNVPYGQSQIRIGFDQPMDPHIANLFLRDGNVYPTNGKFSYDALKKEFSFNFILKPNSHYMIYTDERRTFKTIDGRSSEEFEFSFDTAGLAQNAENRPKIISVSPAPNTVWNKITEMIILFDQPVIPYSGQITFIPESFRSGIMPLNPLDTKATAELILPLILDTSGKMRISDFISESGTMCEPCEIEFSLSSKFLSAEIEDKLQKSETDSSFINLVKNIQNASQKTTSVSEKVSITSISEHSFRTDYGIFRFQQPKQFYCDISAIMDIPFKIGSDGQNCWFFSDSTQDREDGKVRFYQTPYSDINDINIKFAQPFPTCKEPVEIIRDHKLEYIGKETISNIRCEVIRSYKLLNDHFPRITTYWFDAERFLPIRIVQTDTDNYQYDFVYDSINTSLADNLFKYDGSASYTAEKPEPLGKGYTERSIIVHDGSDGRMSGRWGQKGSKGTSSSGLN